MNTTSIRYFLIVAAFFSIIGCTLNPPHQVFPGEEWEIRSPESQGIDSAKMADALDYLESKCKHTGVKEVVIIRNGYMIYGGDQIDSVHNIWSCSKTFTSTVLGLLVDDGIIVLENTAAVYEPDRKSVV